MARQRRNREFVEEQPSATIQLIPKKQPKPWINFCTWDVIIIMGVVFTAAAYMFLYFYLNPSLERLPPVQGVDDGIQAARIWGTYRSQMYLGLRTRSPQSPLFGMMWYEQPEQVYRPSIRHWCNQDDGLPGYSWYEADGRTFGRQNITEKLGMLQTDWLNDGQGFVTRVKINMRPGKRYNVIFYLAAQDINTKFSLGKHMTDIISVRSDSLGKMKVSINIKEDVKFKQFHSTHVSDEKISLDKLPEHIMDNLEVYEKPHKPVAYLLNGKNKDIEGRFIAIQFNLMNVGEFDVAVGPPNWEPVLFDDFDQELARRSRMFNKKFENTFELANKNYTAIQLKMAKVALSNMLGSIGFSQGMAKVQTGGMLQPYGPHTLFSAVPSRPFFPRGFLWDEGFHNMLIRKFDPKMTLEIVVSWMNLMESSGWIPREVILGPEAEAKVPAEYIPQKTDVANPPSFFYVIDKLIHDEKVVTKYPHVLRSIYPRLEKWFLWLRSTQFGGSRTTFRWRGRNETTMLELNPKTMSSGLDDFPRASHPTSDEYHLDLRCWLALCSRVMERLSKLYGTDADHRKFAKTMEELNDFDLLVKEHWSEKHEGFFDYGKHSEDVALVKVPMPGRQRPFEYQRVTSVPPTNKLVTDIFGYNNLYPLMFKLIPSKSPKLKTLLDKIRDPKLLWTSYGLRSISRSSSYYQARNTEHDPPYWRGYIWININYMTLSALHHYSEQPGPYRDLSKDIFQELRTNLVNNMAKQFNATGFLWENYDDKTGEGRGCHPFTGWSSLILMIMSDNLET